MVAKLDPLNAKELKGEVEEIIVKEKLPCFHKFTYKEAGEIICIKCNMGFYIQGDEHLKNGHLFKGDKRII
jgi:hypothetical protein